LRFLKDVGECRADFVDNRSIKRKGGEIMICVEVHPNNVLTLRDEAYSKVVSDSVKHETVKFLFSDNWKDYTKTAVFTAKDVEPINVLLRADNQLCLSDEECYIPFEVLKGNSFTLSVFGVCGDRIATSTKENIILLESGYVLGDKPQEPTPNAYSQVITLLDEIRNIAYSVRQDADNGLFNGEKGEKGEKGDKGDSVGQKTEALGEIFNDLTNNVANKNAHAEGNRTTASGNSSHAEGNQTTASGNLGAHAEGLLTVASGDSAHAEGQTSSATGACSHAEGSNTKAVGNESHAEGISTSAKGSNSHAEGYGCSAIGAASHAGGGQTTAWGKYSLSGGYLTNAYANYSASLGNSTRADYISQFVVGKFNSRPSEDSVFTVGIGSSEQNRKNAFNVYADGTLEIGTVKITPTQIKKLLQLIQE